MTPKRLMSVAILTILGIRGTFAATADADKEQVVRGEYLVRVGDCVACHTSRGGKPLAGGLPLKTPLGVIYSTNITPDKKTGIGEWSYEDFAVLMRRGETPAGYAVYPAMPYPSYSRVNDADLRALYSYLRGGVQPVVQTNRKNGIPWPLSMRWPLKIWRAMYAPTPAPYEEGSVSEASVVHGAYLVQGLGHCGSCHTPRSITLEEKALTASEGPVYLSGGGAIDRWIAPSLRNEHDGGLAAWTESDIADFLLTGRNERSASFGAMNDVVVDSTQYMTNIDRTSIAMFLKSLGPRAAKSTAYVYDGDTAAALYRGQVPSVGAQIYLDRCAGCHKSNGQGNGKAFPALAGNAVLQTRNSTSAIHIVLSGGSMPPTRVSPSALTMGPYDDVLDDVQVAEVVSFIQTSWGNRGAKATANDVKRMRKTSEPITAEGYTLAEPELSHDGPVH